MENKILNEELERILEIMNVKKHLINEGIGDDVIKNVLKRLESNGLLRGLGITFEKKDVIGTLRKVFKEASEKEIDDILIQTEFRPFTNSIDDLVNAGLPENKIVESMKKNYQELFDDAGKLDNYIKRYIKKTPLKGGMTADMVIKSKAFLDNPLVKANPGFYKKIVKDEWSKLQSFFREGVIESEEKMLKYVEENYSGPTYNMFQKIIKTELGKKIIKYGKWTIGGLVILRIITCWSTIKPKTARNFGYCLGVETIKDVSTITNLTIGAIFGIVDEIGGSATTEKEKDSETPNDEDEITPFKNFIIKLWGIDIIGNEKYYKDGSYFVVEVPNVGKYNYEKTGDVFKFIP